MSDTHRTDFACGFHDMDTAVSADFSRQLEIKLNAANERVKRLEQALDLALKMRSDWLDMQEDGYAGAYYAFVKGNDEEWIKIIAAKEAKP